MNEKIDKNTAIQIARNFFSPPLTQDASVIAYEYEANDITYWQILFSLPAPENRKFPEFDYSLIQVNAATGDVEQMRWEW